MSFGNKGVQPTFLGCYAVLSLTNLGISVITKIAIFELCVAGRPCAAACPAQRLTLTGPDAQNGQNPWFLDARLHATQVCDTDPKSASLKCTREMKLREKATLEFHTCDAPLLCWKLWGNNDSLIHIVAQHALTNGSACVTACGHTKTPAPGRQAARSASAAQRLR